MLTIPILAGLAGTIFPAFGHLPAIGADGPTLAPWRALIDEPAFGRSVALTLSTGLMASLISILLAVVIVAVTHVSGRLSWIQRALAPLIAFPHAALAVGLAFLLVPSGWLVRLISPGITGWEIPPGFILVNDPAGLTLVLGLVIKETPFLILMMLAALGQFPAGQYLTVSRCCGYRPLTAWMKVVFPQVYPRIRLPVLAVIAYSLTVVDLAMILGPTTPPTLSVMIVRWFSGPDLSMRLVGAAGALLLCLMVAATMLFWLMGEYLVRRLGTELLSTGGRRTGSTVIAITGWGGAGIIVGLAGLSAAGLLLWSLARRWRFPDALPSDWHVGGWVGAMQGLSGPVMTTVTVGIAASALALILTIGCLETERRYSIRPGPGVLWLVYVPLLVPQIGFLFGIQILAAAMGAIGTVTALIWVHLLFVLPYVYLTLADPWRRIDPRFDRSAASLGAGRFRRFYAVILPLMLRPIVTAAAVGFAVSVALYLPTLFVGAGRLPTLATETVGMAAGGDRRLTAIYAFALAVLPWLGFTLALSLPRLAFRHRKGMMP